MAATKKSSGSGTASSSAWPQTLSSSGATASSGDGVKTSSSGAAISGGEKSSSSGTGATSSSSSHDSLRRLAIKAWTQWFQQCGIPKQDAEDYAKIFVKHRVQRSTLRNLTKDLLYDVGIKRIGDVISILRAAQDVPLPDKLADEHSLREHRVSSSSVSKAARAAAASTSTPALPPATTAAGIAGSTTIRTVSTMAPSAMSIRRGDFLVQMPQSKAALTPVTTIPSSTSHRRSAVTSSEVTSSSMLKSAAAQLAAFGGGLYSDRIEKKLDIKKALGGYLTQRPIVSATEKIRVPSEKISKPTQVRVTAPIVKRVAVVASPAKAKKPASVFQRLGDSNRKSATRGDATADTPVAPASVPSQRVSIKSRLGLQSRSRLAASQNARRAAAAGAATQVIAGGGTDVSTPRPARSRPAGGSVSKRSAGTPARNNTGIQKRNVKQRLSVKARLGRVRV